MVSGFLLEFVVDDASDVPHVDPGPLRLRVLRLRVRQALSCEVNDADRAGKRAVDREGNGKTGESVDRKLRQG
jgi:hypothetical protein